MGIPRPRTWLRVVAPALAGGMAVLASAGPEPVEWIRLSSTPEGAAGNGGSLAAVVSANGRYAALMSSATDLGALDGNGDVSDIWFLDRRTGTARILSSARNGEPGDAASFSPSISANGRFVVFGSLATNIGEFDTAGKVDVFLSDTRTLDTFRISMDPDGFEADGDSYITGQAVSGNGRWVVFSSTATNITDDAAGDVSQIYLLDVRRGEYRRISVDALGEPANGLCDNAVISPNGRFIAFRSYATNLGSSNGFSQTYLHDARTGSTEIVSRDFNGNPGSGGDSYEGIPSNNGRWVLFNSDATNLAEGDGDTNGVIDAYLLDRKGYLDRVSLLPGGYEAPAASYAVGLHPSGRFAVLFSADPGYVAGDGNGAFDVLRYDARSREITLLSGDSGGNEGNGSSTAGIGCLSANGKWLTIGTTATNLVPGDGNGAYDALLRPVK